MKRTRLFLCVAVSVFLLNACRRPAQVASVSTEAIPVTIDCIAAAPGAAEAYTEALAPKKAALEAEMSVVLGYAPEDMVVHRPECNMLNWASDALLAKARQYYDGRVDMAVVNIGGMRCEWRKGDITRQHVFELMPFDNRLVVLTLRGEDLLELCQVFAEVGGEGVAGLRMQAEEAQLIDAQIDGRSIDPEAYYTVATSDYLAGGTDHMTPLTRHIAYWDSDLLIRDLYLDYVRERQTVSAAIDGRMQIN
ncbi:MAG: 5'-nucleotidase C-terminal domain-containing protein [Paludibacteraceae bacterium]